MGSRGHGEGIRIIILVIFVNTGPVGAGGALNKRGSSIRDRELIGHGHNASAP
jgi:hypothetical protein